MEVEVVVPLDEEPWERLLLIDGRIEHSPPTRHYPGHTEVEAMSVEWSEYDPVDPEDRQDPLLFFEDHEDEIMDQLFERVRDAEIEKRQEEPPGI